MQTYIAYKYSNVDDKASLRDTLLEISKILKSFGHTTFILGRDVQNWDNRAHPVHSKLKKMISEIKKSHCVFVYVNSKAISIGLGIEIHVARLLGKKIVLAVKDPFKAPYLSLLANHTVKFDSFNDLREQLKLCQ